MENRDPATYAIVGAATEVHPALGCGFPEPVCPAALGVELALRTIPRRREPSLPMRYKSGVLPCLICGSLPIFLLGFGIHNGFKFSHWPDGSASPAGAQDRPVYAPA
ncbi:GxxExxY protein [Asticcacaulis solisilvae]|uniref:GxxExxY protein n=1 Tax=Asticcacaulis solisilvae TaxID=1217274 RepID=UPI003FD7D1E4